MYVKPDTAIAQKSIPWPLNPFFVDDAAPDLRLMASTLLNAGYTVATAQNGKQVIEATAQKPNLIIQPTSRVRAQPLTAEEQATVDGHPAGYFCQQLGTCFRKNGAGRHH